MANIYSGSWQPQLIWQNTSTGDVVDWHMSGTTWTGGYDYLAFGVPLEWQIVGAAVLNTSGQQDLIWQSNKTGDVTYWQMSGYSTVATGYITSN